MDRDVQTKKQTWQRKGVMLFLTVFLLMQGVLLLYPVPARAFPVNSNEVGSVPETEKKIGDQIVEAILSALLGSLVNMASYFMRTLAYDTASYIASGGHGQGSLIFEKPFDEYLGDVALDSVGEAVSSLGSQWGMDLCQPPELKLQAQLKIGLDKALQDPKKPGASPGSGSGRPQAKCSWQKLSENWKDGPLKVDVDVDFAANLAGETNIMETDFGFTIDALNQLEEYKTAQKEVAALNRQVNEGFKSVSDKVSGYINTPASLVKEEATALTGKHQGEQNAEQIAGMYASELWQIIPMSASVFLNTLTSQLMTRLFTKGLVPTEKEQGGAFDFYSVNTVISKRQVAERAFSFLTAATGRKDPAEYDIVADFSSCPQRPGFNNCVMNRGIIDALDRVTVGRPVTLYDAVFVENLLSPNTPLISPRRVSDNEDINCYKDKLCYSNIQKMRRARILPLGFEIAALRSDPDNPWTIGQVLEGFENCTRDANGNTIEDQTENPFCHLINPNWILRAPQARCENRVYSPDLLVDGSPKRREECVDISTCISEDENGNCTTDNYYGFCTEEKNVWDIPGESCEAQFATCQTFTNTETNNAVSYLTRTLEYGSCNANAVGCQPYVTEQTLGTNNWVGTQDLTVKNKLAGAQQVLFFNDKISASGSGCPESSDGCTQFVGADRDPVTGTYIKDSTTDVYTQDFNRMRNLKKAPNYLGCYDTDSSTSAVDYPTTPQQIQNNITTDPRCDAYASVCLPEEVGCEEYTPKGSGENVPGVVGNNFCPASCVGYSTYKQGASTFESARYPLYFIPDSDNGISCSALYVGCDEFTNISSVETGGEGLEYYSYIKQCEVPDGDNSSVYYTWEGSESQGFILRVHRLAKVGDSNYIGSLLTAGQISTDVASAFPPDAPVYADDLPATLSEYVAVCNEVLYNNRINKVSDVEEAPTDCRALYDSTGSVFYRLLAGTVTVSDACHPLRKTESRMLVDIALVQVATNAGAPLAEQICAEKKGYWGVAEGYGTPVCQRCAGGGAWVPKDVTDPTDGSCVYMAIDAPGESTSCPASANTCREYIGNAGNNPKPIFETGTDTFEPNGEDATALSDAKSAWSPESAVTIAAESIIVNQHSLRIEAGDAGDVVARTLPVRAVEPQASYVLSFWARGGAQTVSVALTQGSAAWSFTTDPLTDIDMPVSIGTSWRNYTVGPLIFTGEPDAPLFLTFTRVGSGGGIYFLDNVSLVRSEGDVYLLRDSWQTAEGYDAPKECFAPSQDPEGPYPGAALGCAEYTTGLGQTVYATGFERLCREKAVGCAPLWDTQNTPESYAVVYNATCTHAVLTAQVYPLGAVFTPTAVDVVTECQVVVDGDPYSCSIGVRESSCAIPGPMRIPGDEFLIVGNSGNIYIKENAEDGVNLLNAKGFSASIDASSVFIPADTPEDAPVYLTDTPASACAEKYLGCQLVGREESVTPDASHPSSFSYNNQTVINNPSQYLGPQGTLCTEEQVACSSFSNSTGGVTYFKDPEVNAGKLCQYKKPSSSDTESIGGWYLKDVGQCKTSDGKFTDTLCKTDSACGEGSTCTANVGVVPCYPNYFEDFSTYGLWSNGSAQYDGYVGQCPAGQNLCTELVDPYDTSAGEDNILGKSYYVIFDDRVTAQGAECQGKASLREGCVLFDRTDVPNKSFTAGATYAASEQLAKDGKQDTLVTPIATEQNDTNLILKVDRNRMCSEWLACKTYVPVIDEKGREVRICHDLGACKAFTGSVCTEWAEEEQDPSLAFLGYHSFVSRDTDWFSEEPTGYSLYNKYQIEDYVRVDLNDAKKTWLSGASQAVAREAEEALGKATREGALNTDSFYIAYKISDAYMTDHPTEGCTASSQEWSACGPGGTGRCIEKIGCILPVDGTFAKDSATAGQGQDIVSKLTTASAELGSALCKVPPEEDSPFSLSAFSVSTRDVRITASNAKKKDDDGTALFDPAQYAQWLHIPIKNTTKTDLQFFRKEFSSSESNANACQFGACMCEYTKITYKGSIVDYWPQDVYLDRSALKEWGVCTGSFDTEGHYCTSDSDCKTEIETTPGGSVFSTGGSCNRLERIETKLGVTGHCLEYDESRPLALGGDQEFACLTWLPTDTSFSRTDNYNVNPEAGFDPSTDYPTGGFKGLYCTDATEVTGLVDEAQWSVNNMETIQSSVQNWSEQKGESWWKSDCFYSHGNVGCNLGEEVETTLKPDYTCLRDLMIHKDIGKSIEDCGTGSLYTSMQTWAKDNIGSSSVILRMEMGTTRNKKFGEAFCDKESVCTHDREEHLDGKNDTQLLPSSLDQSVLLYSLLPRAYHYSFADPLKGICIANCDDELGSKIIEKAKGFQFQSFGPMIYPPRIWDKNPNSQHESKMTSLVRNTLQRIETESGGTLLFEKTPFTTTHLIPGPTYQGPSRKNEDGKDINMDDVLYRSPYEDKLNEYDLETVHFVPIAFPGGMQKFGPKMLESEIFIPVAYLRNNVDAENGNVDLTSPKFFTSYSIQATDVSNCQSYRYGKKEKETIGFTTPTGDCEKPYSGGVLSYVIQSDEDILLNPQRKLYSDIGSSSEFISAKNNPPNRNNVHRRYVVIFFDPNGGNSADTTVDKLSILPKNTDPNNSNLGIGTPMPPLPSEHNIFSSDYCYSFETLDDPKSAWNGEEVPTFKETSWFAIGMDFNREGEFLGYLSNYCHDYDFSGDFIRRDVWENGINLAVIANVSNVCTEFTEVYKESTVEEDSNKAWTNRVWSGADLGEKLYKNDAHFIYDKDLVTPPPYGAIDVGSEVIDSVEEALQAIPGTNEEKQIIRKIRSYPFYSIDPNEHGIPSVGVPYSCRTPFILGVSRVNSIGIPLQPDGFCQYYKFAGLSNTGIKSQLSADKNAWMSVSDARRYLSQIFAYFSRAVRRVTDWNGSPLVGDLVEYTTQGNFKTLKTTDIDYAGTSENDYSTDTYGSLGIPPQIYSLNPATCFDSEDLGTRCGAGEAGNITISKRNGTLTDYDNDTNHVPDEDPLFLGEADVIIVNRFFLAEASFFAFADDNRMPIRRVMVDWGDGEEITNDNVKGLYKNRKPICEAGSDADAPGVGLCKKTGEKYPTLLTCEVDDDCPPPSSPSAGAGAVVYECVTGGTDGGLVTDYPDATANVLPELDRFDTVRFGNLQRSCTEDFFRYSHIYNCTVDGANAHPISFYSSPILSQVQRQRLFARGLDESDQICIFVPRVQVLDNWGWCNGSCVGGYEADANGVAQPVGIPTDGCYNDMPVEGSPSSANLQQCDQNILADKGINAWTYYQGLIIVVP